MSDELKRLERRVAALERQLGAVIKHTSSEAEVAAVEEAHQKVRAEKSAENARRMSEATRAAHDVNQRRR